MTNATLVKVPFDLARWQAVARERYPQGLPKPDSVDPTQWLFSGSPNEFECSLCTWPSRGCSAIGGHARPVRAFSIVRRLSRTVLRRFADDDGIVCLSPLRGEASAAERLRLWSPCVWAEMVARLLDELLAQAAMPAELSRSGFATASSSSTASCFTSAHLSGTSGTAARDGFSALVNYHKLTQGQPRETHVRVSRRLDSVVRRPRSRRARLAATLDSSRRHSCKDELKKILEGEPPYDIFVRWKPLASSRSAGSQTSTMAFA